MKGEFIKTIMPALYVVLGASISGVIQIITTYLHNKNEKKIKKIERKTIPYQKIYNALMEYKDYFFLFVCTANEYKENRDPELFAPLETNSKFRTEYKKYRMFLSNKLQKKVNELQIRGESMNNLGIILAGPQYQDSDLKAVEIESKVVISLIDNCVNQIRKELDLDD